MSETVSVRVLQVILNMNAHPVELVDATWRDGAETEVAATAEIVSRLGTEFGWLHGRLVGSLARESEWAAFPMRAVAGVVEFDRDVEVP